MYRDRTLVNVALAALTPYVILRLTHRTAYVMYIDKDLIKTSRGGREEGDAIGLLS